MLEPIPKGERISRRRDTRKPRLALVWASSGPPFGSNELRYRFPLWGCYAGVNPWSYRVSHESTVVERTSQMSLRGHGAGRLAMAAAIRAMSWSAGYGERDSVRMRPLRLCAPTAGTTATHGD